MKKELSTNGFTMTELVVTVALMGTLLSLVAPKFTNVSEETQGERNIANMHTIREVFFHYFYRSMQRKGYVAHFPPEPSNPNKLMDDEWSSAAIDSTISLTSPNNLFSRGVVPKNSNNNPFFLKLQGSPRIFDCVLIFWFSTTYLNNLGSLRCCVFYI